MDSVSGCCVVTSRLSGCSLRGAMGSSGCTCDGACMHLQKRVCSSACTLPDTDSHQPPYLLMPLAGSSTQHEGCTVARRSPMRRLAAAAAPAAAKPPQTPMRAAAAGCRVARSAEARAAVAVVVPLTAAQQCKWVFSSETAAGAAKAHGRLP